MAVGSKLGELDFDLISEMENDLEFLETGEPEEEFDNPVEEGEEEENDTASAAMAEIQRLMESIKSDDKVKIAFKQNAGQFWGKIGKVRVLQTKETKGGTKYFLIVADITKNGERLKLIQEWFIGKDGTPKPAPKKNITIPDDYADEVGLMIADGFQKS